MPKVQHIVVENDISSQRIDNYLIARLKLPKSLIYRWIRKGDLRVNKKRVKPTTKIYADDYLRIPPFNDSDVVEYNKKVKITPEHREFLESRIIFENDDFLVVNKPSGMAVHGGSGVNSGLVERLRSMRPHARRIDLAHRLDKETSGCVIAAKKHSSLVYFFNIIKNREVKKSYQALVHGKWNKSHKNVKLPLKRTALAHGERKVVVDFKEGKTAITNINNVIYYNDYSLLDIDLETGRTHQIRVHCQKSSHPIVFDKKYGSEELDKKSINNKFNRLFLHAYKLEFINPTDNKKIVIESPLDNDLNSVLKSI